MDSQTERGVAKAHRSAGNPSSDANDSFPTPSSTRNHTSANNISSRCEEIRQLLQIPNSLASTSLSIGREHVSPTWLAKHMQFAMASRLARSTYVARKTAFARHGSTTAKRRSSPDETTLAGAQHKVSLSGPSLGHLISELSATRPGMEALRQPGQTISEEHRSMIRATAKLILGAPLVIGTGIVGFNYFSDTKDA